MLITTYHHVNPPTSSSLVSSTATLRLGADTTTTTTSSRSAFRLLQHRVRYQRKTHRWKMHTSTNTSASTNTHSHIESFYLHSNTRYLDCRVCLLNSTTAFFVSTGSVMLPYPTIKATKAGRIIQPPSTLLTHEMCGMGNGHGAERGSRTLRKVCYRAFPGSAMCVQNFDDSRGFAIRITYRISLRSSSLWEPRHPLLKVVIHYHVTNDACHSNTTAQCRNWSTPFHFKIIKSTRVNVEMEKWNGG